MFGFVTAATGLLDEENKKRYRGWYCGLCRALEKVCGQPSRLLLTYDMAFLAMLLSSVYGLPEDSTETTCAIHPRRTHPEIHTAASDYAAEMNVILMYYKLLDDWHDDKNPAAYAAASMVAARCEALRARYPRQSSAILTCLEHLYDLEQDGEGNPDLPANCFGRLMGELFVMQEEAPYEQELRAFGRTLGRFIYILDAATDLRADLLRRRYNPLAGVPADEIPAMLQVMGSDFMRTYRRLPVTKDSEILENILCAGIWRKYEMKKRRHARKEKKENKENAENDPESV